MKKFSSLHKGFTLVELMIVIAIIGILAAVLYPAMTGYFERSRDTNRNGAMNQVALAASTFYTDRERYPAAGTNKCLGEVTELDAKYIKSLPKDPKNGNNAVTGSCANGYGYRNIASGGTATGTGGFISFAKMEKAANGNMDLTQAQTTVANYDNAVAQTKPRAEMSAKNDGTTAFAVYNQ